MIKFAGIYFSNNNILFVICELLIEKIVGLSKCWYFLSFQNGKFSFVSISFLLLAQILEVRKSLYSSVANSSFSKILLTNL